MMNTPICDFVRRYAEQQALRLHMPGHKGKNLLGTEALDITEIVGADSLFEASGIIRESEKNAGELFGASTFYSTEGSSLCIRAMLCLVAQNTPKRGEKTLIFAGRNAHKAFLSAAALLDLEIEWIWPQQNESYLSCTVSAAELDERLATAVQKPAAVYLTSPDYLGNRADLKGVAEVCHRHGVLLLVDNAHGAYLRFLPTSLHPMDLGADLCCDSAHKTLPALTGGAYLHVSKNAPAAIVEQAKSALALFGSTSPSYLILQSLDAVNRYLWDGYGKRLSDFIDKATLYKKQLTAHGYVFCGDEPLKWTLRTKAYGYTGGEIAETLEKNGIVCEFFDQDHCVLMLTPEITDSELAHLSRVLCAIPRRAELPDHAPLFSPPVRVFSPRMATFAPCETLPLSQCAGRVLARNTVACPPAVPIVVCGERIDNHAIQIMEYYGIQSCTVVKD